jgi:hypothetical protein
MKTKFSDLSKKDQKELLEFMSSLKKGDKFFGKSKDALAEILGYAEVEESSVKTKPKEQKVVRDTPKKDSPPNINSFGDWAFLATVRNETSNKFWGIKLKSRSRAVICWGRIGTKGQSQETDIGDAINRARKKISEGYTLEFVNPKLIGNFESNMKKPNPLSKEKTVFLTYRGVSISIKSNDLLNIASGVEAFIENDQEYLEKIFSDITKEIEEVLKHRESYDSMTKDERTDLSEDIVFVAIIDLYLNNTPLNITETKH